jgi:hypothetical protein
LGGGANATRPIQSRDAQSANSILDRPARSRPSSRPWPTPPCWPR